MLAQDFDAVLEHLSVLEIERGGRLLHLRGVLADQRGGIALQDTDYLRDIGGILLLRIRTDAGPLALAQMEVEARADFVAEYSL